MELANIGIVPPQKFHHDPSYVNTEDKTVGDLLLSCGENVPIQWRGFKV